MNIGNKNMENKKARISLRLAVRENSLFMLAQKFITPFLNLFITIYIIRKVSVEHYGIYGILITLMDYLILLSAFGLPSIYQRFFPEFLSNRQEEKVSILVKKGLRLSFISSLILTFTVFVFSQEIGALLKISNFKNYFIIWFLSIIFYLQARLFGTVLTSLFLHRYFVFSEIIYALFRCLVIFWLLKTKLGLKGLLIGEVVSYALLFMLQSTFFYQKFARHYPSAVNEEYEKKRIARYGGFSYLNEMGAKILDVSTDLFIISAFLGPFAAGLYAFANRAMELFSKAMPDNLFMEVIRPAFFTKYARNSDKEEIERVFNTLTKFIAFFFFPLVAGIFVLGDKLIIYVFDSKYLPSLSVLWIVASFTALNSFQFPLGLMVQAVERVEVNLYSKIFSIYNLIADLLVVKNFGIKGVAFVTGTAILFKNLFIYLYAQKYVSFSLDFKSISKILLNSGMMSIPLYFMRSLISNIFSLGFVVLIGGLIYFFISFLNKSFSLRERKIINQILPKAVFVF